MEQLPDQTPDPPDDRPGCLGSLWLVFLLLALPLYFLAPQGWWQASFSVGLLWVGVASGLKAQELGGLVAILFFVWFPWELALLLVVLWGGVLLAGGLLRKAW